MPEGLTLARAQENLERWLNADAAAAAGKSYTIGTRSFTKQDAAEIRESIDYWSAKVSTLTSQSQGRGRARTMVMRY